MRQNPVRTRVIGVISGICSLALIVSSMVAFGHRGASQTKSTCSAQLCVARYDLHLNFILPVRAISSDWYGDLNLDETTRYLGFGWGERNFYVASPTELQPTLVLGVRALFFPNSSVIRVRQFDSFPVNVECIRVSQEDLKKLAGFIRNSFRRSPQGDFIPVAYNDRLNARFYEAEGIYSLINNSNSWMVEGLSVAGVDVPPWAIYSGAIVSSLESRCRLS